MAWPEEHSDTVLYEEREFIADKDLAVRLVDGRRFDLWGQFYVNGSPFQSPQWVDITSHGAVGDGSTNDTAAIQSALNVVATGGTVLFPPGKTFMTDGNTLSRSSPPDAINIEATGARIKARGSNPILTFNSSHSVNQIGPIITGGIWDGNLLADSAFKFTDCGTTRFRDVNVQDCTGPAFHLRNEDSFSENMSFTGIRVVRCGGIARYDGAGVTGGSGAESFARQNWSDVFGGQLTANWFQLEGNVYDSRFEHIKGNLNPTPSIAIFASTGGGSRMLNGTRIDQIAVEGGTESALLDMPNITSYRVSFGPDYVLRDGIALFAAGTDHDNVLVLDDRTRPIWIPATRFVATGGVPVLTMTPWPHWLMAVNDAVGYVEELPRDWTFYYCDAVWFNAGAGSGNVNLRWRKNEVAANGGTIAVPVAGSQENVLPASAQNILTTSRIKNAVTTTYGSLSTYEIRRISTSDTLANPLGFVGIRMYRRETDS